MSVEIGRTRFRMGVHTGDTWPPAGLIRLPRCLDSVAVGRQLEGEASP